MTPRRAVVAVLLAAAAAVPVSALVSTSEPAALLVFPLVSVDAASDTDTLIQITNTDEAEIGLRCLFHEQAAGLLLPFSIRLAGNQPLAWRAGAGLDTVPNDGGSIPALGVDRFDGVLRCLAVDASGNPSDRNALAGSATLQRLGAAPASLDAAQYNAAGLAAAAGAPNADEQLVLGGAGAEYAACPAELLLQTFFDGAVLELGAAGAVQRQVLTTLALATCAHAADGSAATAVQLRVVNEFGQTASASLPLTEQRVVPLSRIDVDDPVRSIFHVAVQGTDSGSIRMSPADGAVLAVALQQLSDPAAPGDAANAAIGPQQLGERSESDVVDLSLPPATPTVPPSSCLGDCDGNGSVAINELISGVGIALGNLPLGACPAFDGDGSDSVTINELIAAVSNALTGC